MTDPRIEEWNIASSYQKKEEEERKELIPVLYYKDIKPVYKKVDGTQSILKNSKGLLEFTAIDLSIVGA